MGLACAEESIAGAAGAGLRGLDCADESVAGSFWVFCANSAVANDMAAAKTKTCPNQTRTIFRRITLDSSWFKL
jgi:hypothetical protein